MSFKPHEIEFMKAADLGRLATIQPDGTPQVSPVGFTYNEELGTIDISGYNMAKSRKFRNLAHHDKVAFVVPGDSRHRRAGRDSVRAAWPRRRCSRFGDHPHHAASHHQLRHRRHRYRTPLAQTRYP